jgi:membrane fusion protein (multidrug efflux system)
VKPPARQDYQGAESTDPGAGEGSVTDGLDDDEGDGDFPNEATRIDSSFSGGGPSTVPKKPAPAPAPAAAKAKPAPAPAPAPAKRPQKPQKDPAQQKLAALQSLSLDAKATPGGGSLPKHKPQQQASGGSMLPWVLLVLVVAGFGGNWAYQKYYKGGGGGGTVGPGGEKQPSVRIETVSATGGSGQVHMAAGYVAAKQPISLSASTGGVVRDIKVQNGDKIKKGQLLVQLDDSAARADYIAAAAELRSAEAQLSTKRKLLKIGAATPVDVAAAEGSVAVARGKLAPINQRIAQAKIASPIDGLVLERLAQPGETVNAAAPVMKIADLTLLAAEADIVEADIGKIHLRQAVKVTSDVVADRSYDGTVYEIAQQADKARGTVLTKVELRVPDQSLKPGNSVKCAFQPDAGAKPRIMISRTAVDAQGGVFVVGSDGKVNRKVIKSGPSAGATIEVTEGLSGGERIVSDASQVKDGQQIL